jgi:hypothetical protein
MPKKTIVEARQNALKTNSGKRDSASTKTNQEVEISPKQLTTNSSEKVDLLSKNRSKGSTSKLLSPEKKDARPKETGEEKMRKGAKTLLKNPQISRISNTKMCRQT